MTAATEFAVSDQREMVSFRIAEQDFCVDIMSVREIRGWTPATILPHAPPYVLGVINLRGAVVPIVDLAVRLGLPATEPTGRHVIVICVVGHQTAGFLVDAVSDIIAIMKSAVQPPPDVTSEKTLALIEGVIAIDDRMLRLVDIEFAFPSSSKQEQS